MRFSVLIPSRNRTDLARTAIATVLQQDFDDFEVVVSDNASDDDYASMIASFNDRRIKRCRLDVPVPVTANWNNALAQAAGEYVIMLGDDDALAPGSLSHLNELIVGHDEPEVIFSTAYHYVYPNVMPSFPRGCFATFEPRPIFSKGAGGSFLEAARARHFAVQALKFRLLFGFNSQYFVWRRRFVESLSNLGPFFQSPYPDFYSSIVTMLTADRILLNPTPIAIIGISPKSFGFYFHNDKIQAGNEMLRLDKSDADPVRAVIPGAGDALDLSGSLHYRNWLIACLFVVRNLGRRFELTIDLMRFRKIQTFETAYQCVSQKRLASGEVRAFKARLSPGERRLFSLSSWVFTLFGRLSWVLALMRRREQNIHDRLFSLFRIYPKPGIIFHDIGPHVGIADAWAWLERQHAATAGSV